MSRDQADKLMQQLLIEAGFNVNAPQASVAWHAFKTFVERPLSEGDTVTFGFECNQYGDRDNVLWLSFMRHITVRNGSGWSCGCLFSRIRPPDLQDVHDRLWWWPEHGTIDQWATDVERRSTFVRCLELDGWKWEGFSE
jgi:hypothetical protein